eukprot:1159846-Pelagomonas_calceolata.AAC.20
MKGRVLSRSSYLGAARPCAFEQHPSFECKGFLQTLQNFTCWPILATLYMQEQRGACKCVCAGKSPGRGQKSGAIPAKLGPPGSHPPACLSSSDG